MDKTTEVPGHTHIWDELVSDRVELRGLRGTIDMEADCYYMCRECLEVYYKK